MTALVTQDATGLQGAVIDFSVNATAGDTCECGTDGSPRQLLVQNTSGVSTTVTLTTPGTVSGLAVADNAPTVAAGAIRSIPVPASLYADPADRLCHFACVPSTSVKIACVRP